MRGACVLVQIPVQRLVGGAVVGSDRDACGQRDIGQVAVELAREDDAGLLGAQPVRHDDGAVECAGGDPASRAAPLELQEESLDARDARLVGRTGDDRVVALGEVALRVPDCGGEARDARCRGDRPKAHRAARAR